MDFKTLTLECTELAVIPKNAKPFRHVVYHTKELFMFFLPKININDSSKIEISFGKRGDEPLFDNVLGVTNMFIEDFDFIDFYQLSVEQQQNEILRIIVESLSELTLRKNNNAPCLGIVKEIADKVIHSGFYLKQEIKKLSKNSLNKLFEVNVFKFLGAEFGESWSCDIKNNRSGIIESKWMTSVPDYLNRKDYFKKALIMDDEYIVQNRLLKTVFSTTLLL